MRRWQWVTVGAGAVLFVLALSGLVWWFVAPSRPQSIFEARAAAFGDVAGAVFSAFAFAGLIVTALMQYEELGLQRKELRATREELSGQREAQEGSAAALQAQVDATRAAAELNAATALFEYHEREMGKIRPGDTQLHELAFEHHRKMRDALRERIENALEVDDSGEASSSRYRGGNR